MTTRTSLWAFAGGVGAVVVLACASAFAPADKSVPASSAEPSPQATIQTVQSWTLPTTLSLAGEAVPIDQIDVREKLDRELLVNTYWHSNAMLNMKRASRWFPLIESILAEEDVPDDFKYLAIIESGLTQAVSPAGATGFWQFMKSTGKSYGMEVTEEVDERYHVEIATRAACKYLKSMHTKYGSWSLAAASYNMGPGGLDKRLKEQKVDSYWDLLLNAETGRYVYRILAVRLLFEQPVSYGFNLDKAHMYAPYETVDYTIDSTISSLADFANEQGINYKILKILNPWLRKPRLTVASGKTYTIKLPKGNFSVVD